MSPDLRPRPHHHIDLKNHRPISLKDKPELVLKIMDDGIQRGACRDSLVDLVSAWKHGSLREFYMRQLSWSYDALPKTLLVHTDATLSELLTADPDKATEVFLGTLLMFHLHPNYQPEWWTKAAEERFLVRQKMPGYYIVGPKRISGPYATWDEAFATVESEARRRTLRSHLITNGLETARYVCKTELVQVFARVVQGIVGKEQPNCDLHDYIMRRVRIQLGDDAVDDAWRDRAVAMAYEFSSWVKKVQAGKVIGVHRWNSACHIHRDDEHPYIAGFGCPDHGPYIEVSGDDLWALALGEERLEVEATTDQNATDTARLMVRYGIREDFRAITQKDREDD